MRRAMEGRLTGNEEGRLGGRKVGTQERWVGGDGEKRGKE